MDGMLSTWLILLVISAVIGYYIYKAKLSERLLNSPGPGGTYIPPSVPPGHIMAGQGTSCELAGHYGNTAAPTGDPLAGVMLKNLLHNGLINQSQFEQWRELPVGDLQEELVGNNVMNRDQVLQFTNRQQELLRNSTLNPAERQ
ncbi:hypothetical protein HM1_2817 [Heliomicrobium modesticaldum Ice1]|uniref:Uncharacterized protein n=2 Tax=Heliomicrobium modesticaldum TaxID=35701 RepID=B0TCF8_HELMI|nr:hypothetical protein HM1_2817 [Heliomicrobium modesticaldum Ice1]